MAARQRLWKNSAVSEDYFQYKVAYVSYYRQGNAQKPSKTQENQLVVCFFCVLDVPVLKNIEPI